MIYDLMDLIDRYPAIAFLIAVGLLIMAIGILAKPQPPEPPGPGAPA